MEAEKRRRGRPPCSLYQPVESAKAEEFAARNPKASARRHCENLERLFGIRHDEETMRRFLKKLRKRLEGNG
jgi:transposase